MKPLLKTLSITLLTLFCFTAIAVAQETFKNPMGLKSAYIDYTNQTKVTKNVVKDYGMKSSKTKDQSALFQTAINEVSAQGGGKLFIPKGTYLFARIYMKSNVHIIIDKGTVLKPYWGKDDYVDMFYFFNENSQTKGYIENCSISGKGGRFIVDYADIPKNEKFKVRFALLGTVNNFSITDADIKDNYSVFCALSFAPSDIKGSLDWPINRPTNGEVKNCSIFHANPGYGLCQLHGARNLYFENLYALGGVALRLETGADTPYIGIYDIYGHNIQSENGRCALMMGPHIAQNGTVKVDGLWAKSSGSAFQFGAGHISQRKTIYADTKPGIFANDSKVINIHAIYGTTAQSAIKKLYAYQPSEYSKICYDEVVPFGKWLTAPSITAVIDGSNNTYHVTIEHITTEGFPFKTSMIKEEELPLDHTDNGRIKGSIPQLKQKPVAPAYLQEYNKKNKKSSKHVETVRLSRH